MFQGTSKLTHVLAGVALATLPIVADAQSTATPQPQNPTRTTTQQSKPTGHENSPQHHLDEAEKVLNSIEARGEANSQIAELRRHFAQLKSAWQVSAAGAARSGAAPASHAGGHTATTGTTASGTTSGTPAATAAGTTGTPEQAGATGATTRQTPRSGTGSEARGAAGASGNWMSHYQAIDNLLDRLLGDTGASAGVGAGVSAGTTAGTTGSTAAGQTSGAGRTGVSAGVSASANVNIDAATRAKLVEFRKHIDLFHATAMAQGRVGEEDAASASAHSGITGSMTQSATSAQTQTPPSTSMSASGRVDSATFARLAAQIDELLGTASTSSTSSTVSGAVGTSGTATSGTTGTVCVDRAKLEQLKRDIQALQQVR